MLPVTDTGDDGRSLVISTVTKEGSSGPRQADNSKAQRRATCIAGMEQTIPTDRSFASVVVHTDSGGCASNQGSTAGSTAMRIFAYRTLASTSIIKMLPAVPIDHAIRECSLRARYR